MHIKIQGRSDLVVQEGRSQPSLRFFTKSAGYISQCVPFVEGNVSLEDMEPTVTRRILADINGIQSQATESTLLICARLKSIAKV